MNKTFVLLAALCFLTTYSAMTQENFDVLPSEGRNKLFHNYLMEELDTLMKKRQLVVEESLASAESLELRQAQLKQAYLDLLGTFPDKSPLNAVIAGAIACNGYHVEKVSYESLPNHHVTANMYIPETGTGPYPGILMTCGHYMDAKSHNLLQSLCILLVKKGFVVLIVDPIGYGERDQIINPATGKLAYTGESGTTEHTMMDVGSVLTGSSVVAQILWDNHRGIDYLVTRPEVDASRIGCTGSSGGGTQATYLAAFDDRVKVTVVDSYIMNEQALFKTAGPQTASQNLSYEGLHGIDHPDYITMFAPKPFMITASTQDFFDINATRQTYADAQRVYEKLGAPEKIGFFESDAAHGLNGPKREATVTWFRTWFYDDTTSVNDTSYTYLTRDTLLVTETGEVMTAFEGEVNVTDMNKSKADALTATRTYLWTNNPLDTCMNKVRSLIRTGGSGITTVAEKAETIDREKYSIEKINITSGNHTPVTGLFFASKDNTGKLPAVLYVDGRGKKTDAAAGGLIEQVYVDSGKIVFAIDVRGFGETTDDPNQNESKHNNNEHRNAVISLYIGKTLIGQRVDDIRKATDYLITRFEVNPDSISIVGIGRAGIAVLHAAALDSRYTKAEVRGTDTSWLDIIENPMTANNMTQTVPFAMLYYDLPDLVNAIAPRQVIYNPPDYVLTGIRKDPEGSSDKCVLGQNHPNPFQHETCITYSLTEPAHVKLVVYDSQGKKVTTLVNENQYIAEYSVTFEAPQSESGIYFCQLYLNGKRKETKKMIVF